MILLQFPKKPQPESVCNTQLLLEMQTFAFETLVCSLRKLDPALHELFMAQALTVVLGVPGLSQLPTITLAELLFAVLESFDDPRDLLDMQNVMIFATHQLEAAYEFQPSCRS